ncbi:sensor histidine kinase NtrY-like [Sandarakinorhabdus rubra]|uniref:sensor histidine kinase NtrY-like n=1 Tax=Sandarakinorhabdus rubra TaxID=2672568 RepID=UPI0013DBBB00|nr:PAS domain-containing sensor histidine kinase [Sandarakinorhabdus rubra]
MTVDSAPVDIKLVRRPRTAGQRQALRLRRGWRRLQRLARSGSFYPSLELAAATLTILLGWSSYAWLTRSGLPANGASQSIVGLLVVANLVPAMLLIVLIGRRVAILISNRRRGLAGARLHLRLVALFASVAAVPTVLVVVFASLLFQFGVQFWFSDRVRTILDGSNQVAQAYVEENRQRIADDIAVMAADVASYARDFGEGSDLYRRGLEFQVAGRTLSEAAVVRRGPDGLVLVAASKASEAEVRAHMGDIDLARAMAGPVTLIGAGEDRVEAAVAIPGSPGTFLYASRKVDPAVLARARAAANALGEYRALAERGRVMQLRFNLVLMAVSLLTLIVAIWFALWLANRLVEPIAGLARAAERVGAGDLDARVAVRGDVDEIGVLERAFNRMTSQLKAQQTALLGANDELDARRRFTEAVLAGVSAGVMSIAPDGEIRVANASAASLLALPHRLLRGRLLREVAPELAELLEQARQTGEAGGQVRIQRGTEIQTLAVRIGAAGEGGDASAGFVLTFDDISAQLADQRRAAWADVARRIAHEIKNPLTPIQLAAERLQRKFGKQIEEDAETFTTLTGTIVRQVGDLRRMVDEFSAFARLPKPVFAPEHLERLLRQALVLQEVAFPQISFRLDGETDLSLVCDRQQLGRALTNLIKNAAESVSARLARDGEGAEPGVIRIHVSADSETVSIAVADNGLGLPQEDRMRLLEPYVTTRARGTGLGLSISAKIVEDHGGTLDLDDNPAPGPAGSGALVTARISRRLAADSQPALPLAAASA